MSFSRTGNVLRRLRLKKELTQAELAGALGLHSQFCSNWERGTCAPPKHCLRKLSKLLGLQKEHKQEILHALMEDRFEQTKSDFEGLV